MRYGSLRDHTDLSRAQSAVVDPIAGPDHMKHRTRLLPRHGDLEHCLVLLRVEGIALLDNLLLDAELGQSLQQRLLAFCDLGFHGRSVLGAVSRAASCRRRSPSLSR